MDHEVLREMETSLAENKTLEKSKLHGDVTILPKGFCYHILRGITRNMSLSDVDLSFLPQTWYCPDDGRLVYVSHILCDSVGCSV